MEIQSDIATDIIFSMHFTRRYLQRDSVKNLLFNNELTADDIKSGRFPHVGDLARSGFRLVSALCEVRS